jgi:lipopolysaccharide/colanic/teichoic acid biosynthesis glycosyltransferase
MTSPLDGAGLPSPRDPERPTKRVIVVGPEVAVLDLTRRLCADPEAELRVVGACVPDPARSAELVGAGVPVLGDLDALPDALGDEPVDGVVLASAEEEVNTAVLRDLLCRLDAAGVALLRGPESQGPRPDRRTRTPLVQKHDIRVPRRGAVGKAVFDRLTAAALFVLMAPWLVVIALAIRLESGGPVLVRDRRTGQWGREFDLLRFGVATGDADRDTPQGGTTVGRFLHRFALDELPQLLNVLRGDMSLVGPRPQLPLDSAGEVTGRHPWLPLKPGLTGLWYVDPTSDPEPDRPVPLNGYADDWSLARDLGILWRSLGRLPRRRSRY